MSKISATANLSAHPTWRQCQFGTFEATGEVLLLLTTTELFGLRLNETTTQLRAHLLDHLDKLCEASYFYVFVSKGKGPEMQLAGVATILVCLLARVKSEDVDCGPGQTFVERLGSCCSECDPGHGVVLPCTATNDTVCRPCPSGHYSVVRSYEHSCELCSMCPKNSHPVHKCNATHNTKCECDKDFYYDSHRKICRSCSQCKHGEGAKKPCDPYHDTTCENCPPGTFSDVYNGVAGCLPCKKCPSGHSVKLHCSPIQDTICQDSLGYIAARKNGSQSDSPESIEPSHQPNIIPYYCAALGVVLLILIAYVIMKRWRLQPCNRPDSHPGLKQKTASPAMSDHSSLQHHNNRRPMTSSCGNNNSKNVTAETQPILVTNDTLVRNLPGGLRRDLENRLGQSQDENKNWVALAKYFGYSVAKIRSFETASISPQKTSVNQHSSSRAQGAKIFLNDWVTSGDGKSATLGHLISALGAIKRDDIAQTLISATNSRSTWTPIDIV